MTSVEGPRARSAAGQFSPPPRGAVLRVDAGTVCVHWVPLVAAPERVNALRGLLNADEEQRAERYRSPHLTLDFIVARAVQRVGVGAVLGRHPAAIQFALGPHGKPFVDGAPVRFNASGAGGVLLMAFARDAELGVDVEPLREMPDALSIAEHFFCAEECAVLRAEPAADRSRSFLRCWTKKEAFLKATGDGLMAPLNTVPVAIHAAEAEIVTGSATWSMFELAGDPGYAAALAIEPGPWKLQCWRFRDVEDYLACAGGTPVPAR